MRETLCSQASLATDIVVEQLDSDLVLFDHAAQKIYRFEERDTFPLATIQQLPRRRQSSHSLIQRQDLITFFIAGHFCGFRFPDEFFETLFRYLFGHLERHSEVCDLVFDVSKTARGYLISSPTRQVCELDTTAAALSLKAEILDAILHQQPGLMAFHAAALAWHDRGVMIAGGSGSGKSTLAMTLNAGGFDLIGDDVVLIHEGEEDVFGFATASAIKEGSWDFLQRLRHDISSFPIVARPDGRNVRYIRPSSTIASATLRMIVFPHFVPEASFSVEPMTRLDALIRILSEARNGEGRLSQNGFSSLCRILRQSKILSCRYSCADEAALRILGNL